MNKLNKIYSNLSFISKYLEIKLDKTDINTVVFQETSMLPEPINSCFLFNDTVKRPVVFIRRGADVKREMVFGLFMFMLEEHPVDEDLAIHLGSIVADIYNAVYHDRDHDLRDKFHHITLQPTGDRINWLRELVYREQFSVKRIEDSLPEDKQRIIKRIVARYTFKLKL